MNINPIVSRLMVVAAFFVSTYIGYSLVIQNPPKDCVIKIEVAPSVASVTIDGNKARVGDNKVVSGKHIVKASLDGFADQTQSFNVRSGDNVYAGFVLDSSTDSTADWYTQNETDAKLAEGISSHIADYTSSQSSKQNTLTQELPYSYGDGHGGLVNIAQGVPVKGSSQPAIYVDASTPADRQEVLEWIRSNGYNPADMDIVFSGQLDAYVQTEGGE